MVANYSSHLGADPHHYCFCYGVFTSWASTPWVRFAPGSGSFFPILALADHRYGDQRVGSHSLYTPRTLRARGGSTLAGSVWLGDGRLPRGRALSPRGPQRRNLASLWARHPR